MAYLSSYEYYYNSENVPQDENWGSYQYVALSDIVNNFILMYTGSDKIIKTVDKSLVKFHAKRGIQEMHYDAMKEVEAVMLTVGDAFVILPQDYVDWVRVSLYKNGVLYVLSENPSTNHAISHLQDNQYNVLLDQDGDLLTGTSLIDWDRITGEGSDTFLGNGVMNGRIGYRCGDDWFFNMEIGGRFGLETSHANINPTFRVDKASGTMKFSSDMTDEEVLIEYVSDGMKRGNDADVVVHKFLETFLYEYINYEILSKRDGITLWERREARNKLKAARMNSRIRMSKLSPGNILQAMRGRAKWIK